MWHGTDRAVNKNYSTCSRMKLNAFILLSTIFLCVTVRFNFFLFHFFSLLLFHFRLLLYGPVPFFMLLFPRTATKIHKILLCIAYPKKRKSFVFSLAINNLKRGVSHVYTLHVMFECGLCVCVLRIRKHIPNCMLFVVCVRFIYKCKQDTYVTWFPHSMASI